MNKNIKLAVAGAVLALSASAANAGIVIPAGDWTLDVSGNVNMYTTWAQNKGTADIRGASLATGGGTDNSVNAFSNGLLPNFLSIGGTTRQNDLDVAFVISLQPGSANNAALTQVGSANNGGLNNRQAFITFGDKSWGSVKVGKDLGIFASDAILSDMTLLGVGAGGGATGGNTTLGRIGYGYIYADWKPQIAYTTPNMNGFQATVGISQAFNVNSYVASGDVSGFNVDAYLNSTGKNSNVAYEGKASYSFAANDVTGKVWVSGIAQRVNLAASATSSPLGIPGLLGTNIVVTLPVDQYYNGNSDTMAYGADIGANVNVAGFGLTGYYYAGNGIGTGGQMLNGYGYNANSGKAVARDSSGGYVQATYVLPTKTKLGASWGISNLDTAGYTNGNLGNSVSGETANYLLKENEMWTVGAYHPLTKHLNLVAEYSYQTSKNQANQENKANVGSLGAILFF
jgi:predicted porin